MDEGSNGETRVNPEREQNNRQIAIATSISCPNWYMGELRNPKDIDKIRGDLSLESLLKGKEGGYQLAAVVDEKSAQFKEELVRNSIIPYKETQPYLSGSRRDAIAQAKDLPQVKTIFMTEPEKVSMMDFVEDLTNPIIGGQADIVIPKRDGQAFETYPPEQAKREVQANRIANEAMREAGLLKETDEDIDWWVGVRAFKNDPDIVKLFMTRTHYQFSEKTKQILQKKGIDLKTFNTELWADAQYVPIVKALYRGLRIKSVPVAYRHPGIQTQSETGDVSFDEKRALQLRNIILAIVQEVKSLEEPYENRQIELVED